MNQHLERLKDELRSLGVRYLVYAPGARNVRILQMVAQEFELLAHPDERSAAFFALGLNAASERLVAVLLVTSGTAVSECYSALIEAYYSRIPFLILTADRPRRYQGRGTPQTIDQVGIFANYAHVFSFADTDGSIDWSKFQDSVSRRDKPVQVNVFLEDPSRVGAMGNQRRERSASSSELSRPLIVVGELSPSQRDFVRMILARWRQKVKEAFWLVCEPLSGLRSEAQELWGGDFVVSSLMERGLVQGVIKIGGCPVSSWWRDLEEKYVDIPVWSFGDYPWPHLAREVQFHGALALLSEWGFSHPNPDEGAIAKFIRFVPHQKESGMEQRVDFFRELEADGRASSKAFACLPRGDDRLSELPSFSDLLPWLSRFADSEWSWVRRWCEWAQGSSVYLGNSLPVRHFDLLSFGLSYQALWAHRGANGIDGQISGFLGRVKSVLDMTTGRRFQALLGDLTAFYDLQSIWWMRSLHELARNKEAQIGIFILNNYGGQIFRQLPDSERMVLPHEIDYSAWVKMMEIPFERLGPALCEIPSFVGVKVFEIQVNNIAQEQLEKEWREWIKNFGS